MREAINIDVLITPSGDADVIEPLLSGIVLGLIPITLAGLFAAAYAQYRRNKDLGVGGG